MAWQDRLLPASFRGIPFFIDSHEFTGGRNVKSHEPPDRNSTFGEDLGRRSPGFRLNAHVLGDAYFFIRDALIKAMEDGSKGILVHPYLGPKDVLPADFTVIEDTKEGRICRITLNFVEAGEKSFPLAIIDAITDFATTVVSTVAQAQNAFQLVYSVAGLPSYVTSSGEAIAKDFVNTVNKALTRVGLDPIAHAGLASTLKDFENNIPGLVKNPASMAGAIDDVLSETKDAVADAPARDTVDISSGRADSLDVFTDLIAFDSENISDIPLTTATRLLQKLNADAMKNLVRQVAVIRLAENAAAKEFDSIDSALSLRNRIIDVLDEQMGVVEDDDLFNALALIKSKAIGILPQSDLRSVETLILNESVPALFLTYDLYESLDNELDIIERNKIFNPAFIAGEIQVLSG